MGGADALMLLAVLLGGLGYAEGGRLAQSLGGQQVINWALLLAAPVALTMLLGEPLAAGRWVFAVAVIVLVALGRMMRVRR